MNNILHSFKSKIGHLGRVQKSANKKSKVAERTDILINITFDELKKPKDEINHEIYENELFVFFDKIQKEFSIKSELKVAYKQLSKFIIEGNKQGKWDLKVPISEVRYKEPLSFRNNQWFIQSSQLNQWNQSWLNHLNQDDTNDSNYKDSQLLASILISATIYGGLCVPEEIIALANCLKNKTLNIYFQKKYIWIDLIYKSPYRANNIVIGDDELCYRKWYPDTITLFWIHNFLKFQSDKKVASKELDQDSVWKIIHSYLTYIDSHSITHIDTFNNFCLASIGVTENIPGVNLCYSLGDYCVGKISSSSLKKTFHFLNDTKSIPLSRDNQINYFSVYFSGSHETNRKNNIDRGFNILNKDIIHTLREFQDEGKQKKNTNQNALNELKLLLKKTKH
ncbi:MAG: hypothetical protein KDC67_09505, partial [Ignavibacteriae bacterium]|nr:hypothetical protein [Ignavibacteriota bacterium]